MKQLVYTSLDGYGSIIGKSLITSIMSGWWYTNPSEKYESVRTIVANL